MARTSEAAKIATPKDLSRYALQAAMSLDAVRAREDADTAVVGEFFKKLFGTLGSDLRGPNSLRGLIPSHQYLLRRALNDATPRRGEGADLDIELQTLRNDMVLIVGRAGNGPQATDEMVERLMRFCLAIHHELLHRREQRLSVRRARA